MASGANNLIQIKRSISNASVPTLANGELAFTQATNTFFIGAPDGSGNIPIGTKLNYGVLTANSVLVSNSTSGIDKVIVANAVITKITANGSQGSSGQILAANSTGGLYWLDGGAVGTNTDAQFAWTNTQSFSNTITFNGAILANTVNAASYTAGVYGSATGGLVANSTTIAVGNSTINGAIGANSTTAYFTGTAYTANNATNLGGTAASNYATKTYADNKAANAYSNATSYADTAAGTAYSNATSYADTVAGYAYTNAVSTASTDASTKAGQAYTNATSYADAKAGNAYSNGVTYTNNKAANAYSNAMSDTLSRNATYTGNNEFSGTNNYVSGYLTTTNATFGDIKSRGANLISGQYDRNIIDMGTSGLNLHGGNYGTTFYYGTAGDDYSIQLSGSTGAVIPGSNGTQDLGTSDKRFGSLYLSGSTMYLGTLSVKDNAGVLNINAISGGAAAGISVANLTSTSNVVTIGTAAYFAANGNFGLGNSAPADKLSVEGQTYLGGNVVITGANIHATNAVLNVKDIIASGNLTVQGTLTSIDTNNLIVKDNSIQLADGQANSGTYTDALDFSIYGTYGNTANTWYSGFYRDHSVSTASNPVFKLFATKDEPGNVVDSGHASYVRGTLNAYLDSGAFVANSTAVNITANSTVSSAIVANSISLTTALAATYGGTGLSSYAAGDLVYAGSVNPSALSTLSAGANGQVLQIVNNLPAYGTLDGGTF